MAAAAILAGLFSGWSVSLGRPRLKVTFVTIVRTFFSVPKVRTDEAMLLACRSRGRFAVALFLLFSFAAGFFCSLRALVRLALPLVSVQILQGRKVVPEESEVLSKREHVRLDHVVPMDPREAVDDDGDELLFVERLRPLVHDHSVLLRDGVMVDLGEQGKVVIQLFQPGDEVARLENPGLADGPLKITPLVLARLLRDVVAEETVDRLLEGRFGVSSESSERVGTRCGDLYQGRLLFAPLPQLLHGASLGEEARNCLKFSPHVRHPREGEVFFDGVPPPNEVLTLPRPVK